MRSFRITYSTAIILTLMPVTFFIALQSPGKIMLLCSSNNCIAVTAKNRRSTVIIICKRRMSVVYCHSHRCGISDFVGHNNGLLSVSVVSANGMLADGLSTACYVMGLERSIDYWRTYGSEFDLILTDEAGEVYVTEPIAEQFSSDFTVHVISQEGVS